MFKVNDPIFQLCERVPDDECEDLEEWSRCNCCGLAETKKLKHCDFCGELACPTDLDHQRPYPAENPQRKRISTKVCLTCNSKFLYREAMFEMMNRIELHDDIKEEV